MQYPGHGQGLPDMDVDMDALRRKYSRPREELEREAAQKGFGADTPALRKQGEAMQNANDKLNDIVMCQNCQAMGTVKKQYGYRVLDEACSVCDGEGVIRKGQAKRASAELKAKVKAVEALVDACEDIDELERLEAALKKRTDAALDAVLPKAPAAAPPAADEETPAEEANEEAAGKEKAAEAVEVA